MTRSANRYDVYLSYAAADAVVAEGVRLRLTEAGLTCFELPDDGTNDERRMKHLVRSLEVSRAVVLILSRASVNSPTILYDAGAARGVGVPSFLLLSDVTPTDVPVFMGRHPMFSLWEGLPKLIAAVRKLPERVPA